MTTLRQRWAELLFFVLVFVAVFCTSRDQLFLDPGTFWHTRTGDLLLERGFLDRDPFSYTYQGQTWIPSQWLAEIGMALLHRLQGLDALMWLTLSLVAGLFAFIGGRFVRHGCHPLLAGLFVALAFFASCYHFHTRPHLFTMVFLCGLFVSLQGFEAGRVPLRRLWWLVPVFAIWTNLHGGMLAGLGTFGLCGIGWGLLFLAGQPSPLRSWREVGELLLIGVLCGLTVFVNPYGWRLPWMWWIIMKADLPAIIMEHRPLNPFDEVGLAILLLAVVYAVFLAGLTVRPRVTWLLPLVWLVLAWSRIRNGPLFCFVTALALAEMLPHTRWMQGLARRSDMFLMPAQVTALLAPARGVLRLPWWPALLPLPFLLTGLLGPQVLLDRKHWPLDLLDTLRVEAAKPNARFFHDDMYGGFFIYYLPGTPVFLDDRCELYAQPLPRPDGTLREALLLDYARGRFHEPARFNRWSQEFGFTHALVRKKDPKEQTTPDLFLEYLSRSPDWDLMPASSPAAYLFRRKGWTGAND